MTKTKLYQLADLGQSAWLDFISRDMIRSGKLQGWIDQGLRGLTSNPSIFNQAISRGSEYDEDIVRLRRAGKTPMEIYDELSVADIRAAADLFRPVYDATQRLDGYISLEINPDLADDTEASIREGRRLFDAVGRPNVMIKVPATLAGFPVVEELLAQGINVNVTLIFSADQYIETAQAYLRGLKRLAERTADLSGVRSVASVFVSRVDTLIDRMLTEKIAGCDDETAARLRALKGRAAVANSKIILEIYKELFSGESYLALSRKGAAAQRVLWGSTSTKNPDYSDIKYVQELIAPATVNTLPEPTLLAFLDHGEVREALNGPVIEAEAVLNTLNQNGIRIIKVCQQLLADGVAAFREAFAALLGSIDAKSGQLCQKN